MFNSYRYLRLQTKNSLTSFYNRISKGLQKLMRIKLSEICKEFSEVKVYFWSLAVYMIEHY